MLSENENQRYARQTLLREVGLAGQLRLKSSRVLVVGAGGLGNPCAVYLAAAGVGTIGVIDDDVVSLSNLQRQILFTTKDIHASKAKSLKAKLEALNPEIRVIAHDERLNSKNSLELFLSYDWIVDATDNFSARALISQVCLQSNRTHIFAGVSRFEGQLAVFAPDRGPCYRCLVPHLPGPGEVPNCAESGVIGAVAGVLGSLQALNTIQLILRNSSQSPSVHSQPEASLCPGKDAAVEKGASAQSTPVTIFSGGFSSGFSLPPELSSFQLNERADCSHHEIRNERARNAEFVSPTITTNERAELLASDEWRADRFWPAAPIWLDVRNDDEWIAKPVAGALEISTHQLYSRLHQLSRDAGYIVFCQSGVRSQMAQDLLLQHGFQNVWNLRGGLNSNDLTHPESTPTRAENLRAKTPQITLEAR